MKSVRLLPVVILAIAALLVFKTIGLVTTGGYVLGAAAVQASEGGTAAAPAADATGAVTMPDEPTLEDTNPTLADTAPTLGDVKAGDHSAPVEAGTEEHPATADGEPAAAQSAPTTADGEPITGPTKAGMDTKCPEAVTLVEGAPPPVAAEGDAAASEHPAEPSVDAQAAPAAGAANGFAQSMTTNCDPKAEGVPMQVDAMGQTTPLTSDDGASLTEKALLERLSARRGELDAYAAQLDTRQALVDAAEKKIDERASTLKALEDQIAALVDQRTAMETGKFAAIVTMYENMKPKDAAAIFDNLNMNVLLQVAKTMNPRKMAPILAAMTAARAQELTVNMASSAAAPTETMTPQDLSALPQIVGQ